MNIEFENPFADYGNIVRGERFIGRSDDLRVVKNRVIRPREPGNLAIIGDYRIGKSSLVYKAVMEQLKPIFEKCREAQEKEEKSFGSRASRNLIDFTYPQDLFAIIFSEWNTFKAIFGKDKNYWDQRVQLLAKMRNPLAHNRDEALYDYEKQVADGYCREILTVLQKS